MLNITRTLTLLDPCLRPTACNLQPAASRRRGAFTLVELLVVITIIGILASLISVAAVNAVYQARQVKIKVEVDQLDAAMKEFKQRFGAYPPCNLVVTSSDPAAAGYNLPLRSFLSKAFPRYQHNKIVSGSTDKLMQDLETVGGPSPNGLRHTFNPARALAFWLVGFSPDVTDPIVGGGTRVPLYGFDKTRVLNALTGAVADASTGIGALAYVPAGGQNAPYIYFDYRQYGPVATPYTATNVFSGTSSAGASTATPYMLDVNGDGAFNATNDTWANADSFQIISAGQDGLFGVAAPTTVKLFPRGSAYDTTDNDNVTNFSDRASLEDARP